LTETLELKHGDLMSIAYRAELDRFLTMIADARITHGELALAALIDLGYRVELETTEGKALPGTERIELADEVAEVVTGAYVREVLSDDVKAAALRLSARCLGVPVQLHYEGWEVAVAGRYPVDPTSLHMNKALVKILEFATAVEPGFPTAAVDLGAAPGGWSSFLSQVCEDVVAVDPSRLEPRVEERVHHLRVTAQEYALPDMVKACAPAAEYALTSDVYSGMVLDDLYPIMRLAEELEVAWAFVKVAPWDTAEETGAVDRFREEMEGMGFETEVLNLESAKSNERFVYASR